MKQRLIPGWFATMVVASAAICLYGITRPQLASSSCSSCPAQREALGQRELYDVLWLDKYPEMQSDQFRGYSFTADNVGIAMEFHSAFKFTLELFEFKANNTQLTYHFPHDNRRAQASYKIEKLKKPTKHFDISLTVENDPANNGKSTTYFSGPNFRSLQDLPSPIQERLQRSGVLQQLPVD